MTPGDVVDQIVSKRRPLMNASDLDPLRVDDCDQCGAVHWRDCVCDPSAARHEPTAAELELAREERLSLAERGRTGVCPW